MKILVLACVCGSDGQCSSLNRAKGRFGLASVKKISSFSTFAVTRPAFSVSKYSLLARGGDNSVYDERYDDEFSHLIESFESKLFEIRREAEMETELEMKKILGLVGKAHTRDDGEDLRAESKAKQILRNDEMENYEYRNEIDDSTTHSDAVQPSTADDVIGGDDNISVHNRDFKGREEIIDKNEDKHEHSEDVEDVIVSLRDEETTHDPREKRHDKEHIVELPEREQNCAVNEEILQDTTKTDRPSDIKRVESRSKRKAKKSNKLKPKKTGVERIKQRKVIRDDSELPYQDETNKSELYELSSLSITTQKDMVSKRGFRYYVQTDLVRTLILFIATIALSIWMQRVRREMEVEGI